MLACQSGNSFLNFLAVFFIASISGRRFGFGVILGFDLDLDFVERSIRQRAAELGVDASEIVISRGETQIVVRFAGNLVFPSASAVLREDVLPLLKVVGSVIAELPNEVRVEGHTDSVPVGSSLYETNWEL